MTVLGIVLILIILGLLAYCGIISYRGVQAARQKYFQEVANLKKKDVEITIIEGWRREQIAAKLVKLDVLSSPDEFLKSTENLEGQLFPDTYRFFKNSTAQGVVDKIIKNFAKKTAGLKVDNTTLILASIIEREAAGDEERAPIAGVYKNRIDEGMKLEADPTAQYARDSQQIAARDERPFVSTFEFWAPITKAEINATDSPYNTYRYAGLPPGPVCNPGSKSIEAALNPKLGQNFYFFHDADGTIRFSRNLADHDYQKKIYGVRQ